MESILSGAETVTSMVGTVFTMITGNPLLAAFCSAGLISVAIGVFSAVKAAAR